MSANNTIFFSLYSLSLHKRN